MSGSNNWALLIGIDRYHESLGALKYSGADCRALRETLLSPPYAFPDDQVLLLADGEEESRRPTFANIHNHLASWLAAPKEDDLALVYFAGHGIFCEGTTYLMPGDATLATAHTLGIPLKYVQDLLQRCKARRKVLVMDACHSGTGRDVVAMTGGMAQALASAAGIYTISACGVNERSHEWDKVGHGVFSWFLNEALRGKSAVPADGRWTLDWLYEWVHDQVRKWAAQRQLQQTPQRFAQGAGVIVLAESEPDYKALADRYRRELKAAEAEIAALKDQLRRLEDSLTSQREVEKLQHEAAKFVKENPKLRGAALRTKWRHYARNLPGAVRLKEADFDEVLDQALNPSLTRKCEKPRCKKCEVPEWKTWAGDKGPYNENWLGWLIGGGILIAICIAILASSFGTVGLISGICIGTSFLLSPWLVNLTAWQHKYRLHCARLCVEAGDYVQGASFASQIGRLGVDAASVGAVIVQLAETAEANDDIEFARTLYTLAANKWKQPHAKVRLKELETES